jgi:flagellar biosynthetic protein FliR
MLTDYLNTELFQVFLIFCRVGTCMMILPGFGDTHVNPRVRLVLALATSLCLVQVIPEIPKMPAHAFETLVYIGSEMLIGILIGSIVKIFTSALHIAGTIIGTQSSLGQASLFDPNQGSQGNVFGGFMDLIAITMLFTLDLHHMIIKGIVASYGIFHIMEPLSFSDFAEAASIAVSKSFLVGVQISAPLIVIGILLNLGAGILSRLMSAFQVFFVMMPAQIMISFFIFMITFSTGVLWYLEFFKDSYLNFLTP